MNKTLLPHANEQDLSPIILNKSSKKYYTEIKDDFYSILTNAYFCLRHLCPPSLTQKAATEENSEYRQLALYLLYSRVRFLEDRKGEKSILMPQWAWKHRAGNWTFNKCMKYVTVLQKWCIGWGVSPQYSRMNYYLDD